MEDKWLEVAKESQHKICLHNMLACFIVKCLNISQFSNDWSTSGWWLQNGKRGKKPPIRRNIKAQYQQVQQGLVPVHSFFVKWRWSVCKQNGSKLPAQALLWEYGARGESPGTSTGRDESRYWYWYWLCPQSCFVVFPALTKLFRVTSTLLAAEEKTVGCEPDSEATAIHIAALLPAPQ